MKINEIRKDRDLDNPIGDYEKSMPEYIKTHLQFVRDFPNFKGYNLKLYFNPKSERHMLYAFDKDNVIAMVSVSDTSIGNSYKQIYLSKVKPTYANQGIGLAMYMALIKVYGAVLSDYTLTNAGQKLWMRLLTVPSIKVYSYHTYDRKETPVESVDEMKKLFSKRNILLLAKRK